MKGLRAPPAPLETRGLSKQEQRFTLSRPERVSFTLLEGQVSSLYEVEGGQYLQITAPISTKSSGGALFDREGGSSDDHFLPRQEAEPALCRSCGMDQGASR